MTRNVAVLEPHKQGHRGHYARWLTEGLAVSNVNVTLVTFRDSVIDGPLAVFTGQRRMLNAGIRLDYFANPPHQLLRAAQPASKEYYYWRLFRDWFNRLPANERPDLIVIPYLDYCLYAMGLLGSPFGKTRFVGIAMRPSFHLPEIGVSAPRRSVLKRALFARALAQPGLVCLFTIDPTLQQYAASRPAGGQKIRYLPQPVNLTELPDRSSAKQALGFALERTLLVLYGGLTLRKGIVPLIGALSDPDFPSEVDILLAGIADAQTRTVLADAKARLPGNPQRLFVMDRYLDEADERLVLAAADAVWLGYTGHYTASGVLAQAAQCRRAIIGCQTGLIGWQVRKHRLGLTVDPDDLQSVMAAIRLVVQDASALAAEAQHSDPLLYCTIAEAQAKVVESVKDILDQPF